MTRSVRLLTSRLSVVAFAVLASLLIVTTLPIAGAATGDTLVVGSEHTDFGTDTENAPNTITDLFIEGSGAGASITTGTGTVIDSFEDNDLSEWTADSGYSVDTQHATDGTYAMKMSGGDGQTATRSINSDTYKSISWTTYFDSLGEVQYRFKSNDIGPHLRINDTGGVESFDGSNWNAVGLSVSTGTQYEITISSIDYSANTYTVTVRDGVGGTILAEKSDLSFNTGIAQIDTITLANFDTSNTWWLDNIRSGGTFSSGTYISATHNVDNAQEARINITEASNVSYEVTPQYYDGSSWVNTTSSTFTTTGEKTVDLPSVSSSQWRTRIDVEATGDNPAWTMADESIWFTDNPASASNPSLSGGEQTNNENVDLSVDISDPQFGTAQGEEVTVEAFVDGSSIGTQTATSNETLTFSATGLDDGNHTWHVEMVDDYGVESTSSTWDFEVQHYAPVLDNSSANPPDGAKLTEREQTFSIDVSDIDFAEPSGDTVTAELHVDGSTVGSDTLSANGTATVNHTISKGGDHEYYWIATDEYGNSTQSQTFTISVPSELRIYNESAPTQLVDNATVELRMYANETGDAQIYERNTTDGTINMTGIPADQPFVVVSEADGYVTRRIFVPSLYETQSVFLLPETAESADTIFSIEDYTGEFPSDSTVLLVQRSLNGSFQTVLGDYFGATGQFPAQLAYNQRHRLILMNVDTGETRPMGTYTPLTSSTQTVLVTPQGISVLEGEPPSVKVTPSLHRLPAIDGAEFGVSVDGGELTIENWSANASLVTENGSTEVWSYTQSGEGSETGAADLEGYGNATLEIDVTWTAENGMTATETVVIRLTKTFENDHSLLAAISNLADLSPEPARSGFTGFLAMLVTVFIVASIASIQPSGEIAGLAGVLTLAGFSVIAWVSYDVVFVAGVGLISFAAIRRGL